MSITTQGMGGYCLTTVGWGCRAVRAALVEIEEDLEIATLVVRDLEVETETERVVKVDTSVAYLMLVALSAGEDLEIDTEMDTDQEV
jgi:hypothetical protein